MEPEHNHRLHFFFESQIGLICMFPCGFAAGHEPRKHVSYIICGVRLNQTYLHVVSPHSSWSRHVTPRRYHARGFASEHVCGPWSNHQWPHHHRSPDHQETLRYPCRDFPMILCVSIITMAPPSKGY